jgi:hypothetical protein
MALTRSKFEQIVKSLLDRTVQPCHSCMKDAGVSAAEINEVCVWGGCVCLCERFGWVGGWAGGCVFVCVRGELHGGRCHA